jgi:hypothetical protein
MRHQNVGHQTSKKRSSAAHSGGEARMGKGSMGSSRGYKAFEHPANDGNLYTGRSKVRRTDFWGNPKGGARPSACFITTACVEARGLDDACEELALIRGLRDGYVRTLPEGSGLVAEYYREAPGIVEAIEALPEGEREALYGWIWAEGLAPAVAHIRAGRYAEALEIYRSVCVSLQGRLFPGGLDHERRETTAQLPAAASMPTPDHAEGGPYPR